MKKPSDLKKRLREGIIRRATRDVYIAEESASLEDTLSFEEEKFVRKGKAQLRCGNYLSWESDIPDGGSGAAMIHLLWAQTDCAVNQSKLLHQRLPEHLQHQLKLGDDLTIGTVASAEFNGAVFHVPKESGTDESSSCQLGL
jgi:hypothetical protein